MLELHKIIRVSQVNACRIALFFDLRARLARRSVQSYGNGSRFSVFSRLGLFLQVSSTFWQVREWHMLEVYKIIRVLHELACPIAFERSWQGGMFKLFLYF